MSRSARSEALSSSAGILLIVVSFLMWFGAGAANATPYQLSVTKGTGGGAYEPSTVVNISAFPYDSTDPATANSEPADPTAPVRIFDKWTGDTEYVSDVTARDTTVVMPARNISITAQFKDVPRWVPPRILTYFPADPVGVIYLFHGTGGQIADLTSSPEVVRFIDDAASRNFAVVAINSYDRKQAVWDVSDLDVPDNIDLQRVAAVHNQLVAEGKILPSYPIYCAGISNGGLFATIVAQQADQGALPFKVKAVANYISPGNRDALTTTLTPTIFLLAQNDQTIDNSTALSNFDLLINRGIAAQVWTLPPTPVDADAFWGIPGLSQGDSQTLQGQLQAKGLLDSQNFVLPSAFDDADGNGEPDWLDAISSDYSNFAYPISQQLTVSYAGHAFFSTLDAETFDFFANPTTIVDEIPSIAGFSPASGSVGTVVTLTGKNFVDVQSVTFDGTPAYSFSVPMSTTIVAVVPVGATTGPIEVVNPAGAALSADKFTMTAAPVITSFSPSSGVAGQTVAITGQNFFQIDSVSFNGEPAKFTPVSATSLYATVPSGATNGPIQVHNWLGTATSDTSFTLIKPPVISSFSPVFGAAGTVVTISGSNFAGTVAVRFGRSPAGFVVVGDNTIQATVPAGAGTGRIIVANPAGYAVSSTWFFVR